jgi:hypothetical protein
MAKNVRRLVAAVSIVAAMSLASPAQAEVFAGVNFPGGISSFADAVTNYSPSIVAGQPTAPHRGSANALGAPDYTDTNNDCVSAATCPYVTLGDGGSITVEFVDNRLTGSGTSSLDLWIFEIGGDVEDTFVEVSKDGLLFTSVGKVFGAVSGIDLDAFGFGIADQFRFVRLTDDTNEGQQSGTTVGADIDAIGAISTIAATPVPEPETWAMLMLGAAALAARARRRVTR